MKVIYSLEDDVDISKIIHVSLQKTGYEVHSFETGKDFLSAFEEKKPDLVLLDLMLPDCSGIDILKKIRSDRENDSVRLIIISAKRMTMDKVEGLDSGADDYIEKPFDILELISRVNARFRFDKEVLSYHGVELDPQNHDVKVDGKSILLTNTEFEILRLLLSHPDKVITRQEIYEKVYRYDLEIESRSIDMHIASLRKKLKDKENFIRTIYGIGYII